MFLAKFQFILEKLDLFKFHQYILTTMLLPVLSVAAAVQPYVLYQWEREVPEHYAYSKSHSLQCRTFLLLISSALCEG